MTNDTDDQWGYKLTGFPEFGTDFHHVGTMTEAALAVLSIDGGAVLAHEDEFL